ncbi:MAG: PfkB family carbohydrate kinase [Clostridium sp.]
MTKVLVLGAAVLDIILATDKLPTTGEDVMADHKQSLVGGCAYNVANVLKALEIKADLFAPIGNGTYSSIIKNSLVNEGYDILIEDKSQDNGWNLSLVEKDGERTFITIPGIETNWKKEWFNNIDIGTYDLIYVSGYELEGESGNVIIEALKGKNDSCKILFDASPRIGFIDRILVNKLLKIGTIFHSNKSELQELTGYESPERGMEYIHALTGEAVVVTLGKEGCGYLSIEESGIVETQRVRVVDTIGAGDAHTGGLIAGIVKKLSLKESCALANSVATKVVSCEGGKFKI